MTAGHTFSDCRSLLASDSNSLPATRVENRLQAGSYKNPAKPQPRPAETRALHPENP